MKEFLHPLVNRGSSFIWPRFPLDPHWISKSSTFATGVREAMGLSVLDSDWYALGCLQAMAGVPWVAREVGAVEPLMELLHYAPSVDYVGGGTLLPDQHGPPKLHRTQMLWPVDFTMTLERIDAGFARLTVDGVGTMIPARLGPSQLQVEWPESCGVAGALEVPSWVSSEVVTFRHEPRRFPYELIVEDLRLNRDHAHLLLQQGLSGAYTAARSTLEKVAITSLALILDYRSHG